MFRRIRLLGPGKPGRFGIIRLFCFHGGLAKKPPLWNRLLATQLLWTLFPLFVVGFLPGYNPREAFSK